MARERYTYFDMCDDILQSRSVMFKNICEFGFGEQKNGVSGRRLQDDFMASSEQTMCYIDECGGIIQVAPNWQKITRGIDCFSAGDIFIKKIHPQDLEIFTSQCKKAIQTESEAIMQCRILLSSGDHKWFEIIISPALYSEYCSENENSLIIMMKSAEEKIEAENKLESAKAEMILAQKGRYDFLKHMSHELRTPLNAIMGFAEMMECGVYGEIDTPEYQEYLSNINNSGQTLLRRINDMIEMVSIETKTNRIDEDFVHLHKLLEDSIKLYRHEIFCRNISVHISAPEMSLMIKGDRIKLTRAIGNLLSNAVRFSENDSPVMVSVHVNESSELVICVSDKGEGISENQLQILRASLSGNDDLFFCEPDFTGIGLGLTIAGEFAKLHDGRIEIESTKEVGTSASIIIPGCRVSSLESPRQRRQRHIGGLQASAAF